MCDFPAMTLLKLSREAALEADRTLFEGIRRACCDFVLKTHQLALAHEDITNCSCWQDAIKEADLVAQ